MDFVDSALDFVLEVLERFFQLFGSHFRFDRASEAQPAAARLARHSPQGARHAWKTLRSQHHQSDE
jgi:hypothetical protein